MNITQVATNPDLINTLYAYFADPAEDTVSPTNACQRVLLVLRMNSPISRIGKELIRCFLAVAYDPISPVSHHQETPPPRTEPHTSNPNTAACTS